MLSRFSRLDHSRWPILWLLGFFLVQAVPATIIRASNLEEGKILAMARGAAEDGHWITPFIYGERFAERPVLSSWMAALFSELTGGVTLWSLRIPHLCFFLAGALLIYSLLRSVTGKSAAIFGALCWISMPVVAPKFINSEPDIVLSTLLFAAFCTWWWGTIGKSMTPFVVAQHRHLDCPCWPDKGTAACCLLHARRWRLCSSETAQSNSSIYRRELICWTDDRRLVRHGLPAE